MGLEQQLRELGLKPNEARVYLALRRAGASQAGRIAREARLERTSAYDALNRLVRKGLVSFTVGAGKRVFSACDPKGFLAYFNERIERAKMVIPALEAVGAAEREKNRVVKFSGYAGVKTVLNDVLNTCDPGGEFLIMGSEHQLSERMPTFARIFVAQKDRKRLRTRILVREGRQTRPSSHPLSRLTQYRVVPHDVISPTVTSIYGGKVAMIIWAENPEGIIIDDGATARTFRSYFDFMWSHAKRPGK